MYTTQTNRQRERQLDREEEEVATDRQMYTTQTNRQRERQLDREEEDVATDWSMYTTQTNRQIEIVRQRGGGGYRQIDVCNIEQQIEREIVR